MAGRDIRRLVARASLTSSTDKLQAARRLIVGVAARPAVRVLMMDDWEGMGRQLHAEYPEVISLIYDREMRGPESGQRTTSWMGTLEREGAVLVMVVGGDGTQRNAVEALPQIPILAVAGGTNNVACWLGDETAAGYAAAIWAQQRPPLDETGTKSKLIHVCTERGETTVALIDVALVRQRYTGALAVWNASDVVALLLAVADPARPGLSNLGGMLSPVSAEDDQGLQVWLSDGVSGGDPVTAVLAPGLVEPFGVASSQRIALGQEVRWTAEGGGTLALDGERTVVVAPSESVALEIRRDGPWFLHPGRIFMRR